MEGIHICTEGIKGSIDYLSNYINVTQHGVSYLVLYLCINNACSYLQKELYLLGKVYLVRGPLRVFQFIPAYVNGGHPCTYLLSSTES